MSVSKDVSKSLQQLKQLATDIGSSNVTALSVPRRCCFISVNSYTNPQVTLGTGPISDACTVASAAKFAGMSCFFIHNAKKAEFLRWLDKFFSETESCLFFYYVGHGTQVKSTDSDESDNMDEAYYFEDGILIDDMLLDHLIASKNPNSSVILISDCCHSGSIWDLTDFQKDIPPRVISIAAAQDAQTSKQIVVSKEVLNIVSKVEAGVFTSGMFEALQANQALTPLDLKAKLDAKLRQYQQTVTLETTSAEMLRESLFLPKTVEETPPQPEPAVAPKPPPAETPSTKPPSILASAAAATLAPPPTAPKPSAAPTTASKPAATPTAAPKPAAAAPTAAAKPAAAPTPTPTAAPKPAAAPTAAAKPAATPTAPKHGVFKKYQQPVVTILKDGKKTELHRYFTKVRRNDILDFHIISTTIEQTGKKPVVTHVVEIKITDSHGNVKTTVKQYGGDIPWHAGKSKWSAEPVAAGGGTAQAAKPAPIVAMPQSTTSGATATWGQTASFTGESMTWEQLPPYYLTAEEKEKLKASHASLKLPTAKLTTTQDFMNATKKIYSKFATTSATYGCWYRGT